MSKPDYKEQRRFPRAAVEIKCRYRLSEGKQRDTLTGKITILGQGGCFLQTRTSFARGTKLVLDFQIAERPFSLTGEVRCQIQYCWTSKNVQYPGMGICFLDAESLDVQYIGSYVKEILARDIGLTADR